LVLESDGDDLLGVLSGSLKAGWLVGKIVANLSFGEIPLCSLKEKNPHLKVLMDGRKLPSTHTTKHKRMLKERKENRLS